MSSGRDRERERDRERDGGRRAQAASARTNEYFVPLDGIDREVITADICRYLGNDALVRPGKYENPQTRQVQAGYFITAYRNLTTAMIADLKADSERWEAERRAATASRGPTVGYRDSTTHQSRQYYGPTEAAPGAQLGYPPATSGQTTQVYDSSQVSYQQPAYAQQPPSGYAQPQQGYTVQDSNYFVAGADMMVDPRSTSARGVPPAQATIPRSNGQYSSATSSYPAQDNRYYTSQQPGAAVASTQYQTQPTDNYYGRAVPGTGQYDSQDPYDSRVYQDSSTYGQMPVSAATSVAPVTSNSSTRRDREPERERDRHSRHPRR